MSRQGIRRNVVAAVVVFLLELNDIYALEEPASSCGYLAELAKNI